MKKFSSFESGIKEFYEEMGYVIISKLNREQRIDQFSVEYQKFKKKKNYLFNAQDTNRPEKLNLNENGYIVNSIMDPLDLVFAGNFPQKAKDCMINSDVSKILKELTGVENSIHWQSMFFDKSTGTVPHQDSYYLDSDPPGKLLGVWYALEDIHPDSGCFYVCPGSHKMEKPLFIEKSHADYVVAMKDYVEKSKIEKLACPLEKGDVLFWNSLTLHGAFENKDPKYSRKSFTSHFIPEGLKRNNPSNPIIEKSNTSGILVRKKNKLKEKLRYFQIKTKYLISNRLLNKVDMEMKSERYE